MTLFKDTRDGPAPEAEKIQLDPTQTTAEPTGADNNSNCDSSNSTAGGASRPMTSAAAPQLIAAQAPGFSGT